jgi:hypothetical protein
MADRTVMFLLIIFQVILEEVSNALYTLYVIILIKRIIMVGLINLFVGGLVCYRTDAFRCAIMSTPHGLTYSMYVYVNNANRVGFFLMLSRLRISLILADS